MEVDPKKGVRCKAYTKFDYVFVKLFRRDVYAGLKHRTGTGLRVWLLGSHQQTEDNGSQHKEWDWGGVGTVCVEGQRQWADAAALGSSAV